MLVEIGIVCIKIHLINQYVNIIGALTKRIYVIIDPGYGVSFCK